MAAVRAEAPGFLCSPAATVSRRSSLGHPAAEPAAWPRPPTAYPASCEVSPGPCRLLGWEEAERPQKAEAHPVPRGTGQAVPSAPREGLAAEIHSTPSSLAHR